ncbi:MAG: hypothetical protein HZA49_00185 [Planctomycetes bacterium]|nr:hypothetical protein [Planctomycetota bacterium]
MSNPKVKGILICAAVFIAVLLPALYLGITFVLGHGRIIPYVSVWLDRLLFLAVVLGLPSGAAWITYRLAAKRHDNNDL